MKKNQLEIACFNFESALTAQENGADRIELCENMKLGGTTPNYILALKVREQLATKMHVIIRPRGGDFVYSDDEIVEMKQDIKQFKKLKVDGFVFGILNADGTVNTTRNRELVQLASPLPCTFHRAFDVVKDVEQSLEEVISCGFSTILTSGQGKSVVEGISVLKQIQKLSKNRIVIMPGGGLRSANVLTIKEKLKPTFYHSSAITGNDETADPQEIKALVTHLQK
ncbi:copper homeostasis protein CutC [Flavobacterium sp. Fl-77]|uniref:PF03932 family protein CutC n=1 Tax=Flavobacterium flavipigmentatum TaxID=2893884 RepID=A0AAJ2W145_9FLAO|nr:MULTISPECIES: copper homeostasis protein CutC [unclassified Flavobacterium]MDX6182287.1 copper homeostasis protein CutC [Flavobacterium sp. Fl-33]MDX6185800.1 copper homeostasis protein CutC [Flavobacterium sp. Fl-77]UFH38980.1 copper homeostasis protein CutC [Flavobacterium sp. F-70]